MQTWKGTLLALVVYCAIAFLYFGLPVAAHPGRYVVGSGTDPDIFIWSFAWWPHALLHGQNPIFSHTIWAPTGINLAWTTSIPGLALAFAPLTLLVGPVVSYNVSAVLLPALAALTAFLLCRYLTRSFWASLAGGYLFGFSSYMLAENLGHPHVTSVVLLPLVAQVVLRFVRNELRGWAFAWRFGLLLGVQLWFSSEVVATLTLALAAALVLAYVFVSDARLRLVALLGPLAGGYAIAAVLASPFLYYALTGFPSGPVTPPDGYVADLANFAVPTRLTEIGGSWGTGISARFPGNEAEQVAYFGIPTLLILLLFAVRRLRTPVGRFLIAAFLLAAFVSFGDALVINGNRIVTLPWNWIAGQPIFDNILPARLVIYATLVAAVIVALWAAASGPPRWLRAALPAFAVLALVPDLGLDSWKRQPIVPAFFADGSYKRCIARGENVMVIPYGFTGDALLWQARSGFYYRMPEGDVSPAIPYAFSTTAVVRLINDDIREGDGQTVLDVAKDHDVGLIAVDKSDPWPWSTVLSGIGHPTEVSGMLLYPIRAGRGLPAGCATA